MNEGASPNLGDILGKAREAGNEVVNQSLRDAKENTRNRFDQAKSGLLERMRNAKDSTKELWGKVKDLDIMLTDKNNALVDTVVGVASSKEVQSEIKTYVRERYEDTKDKIITSKDRLSNLFNEKRERSINNFRNRMSELRDSASEKINAGLTKSREIGQTAIKGAREGALFTVGVVRKAGEVALGATAATAWAGYEGGKKVVNAASEGIDSGVKSAKEMGARTYESGRRSIESGKERILTGVEAAKDWGNRFSEATRSQANKALNEMRARALGISAYKEEKVAKVKTIEAGILGLRAERAQKNLDQVRLKAEARRNAAKAAEEAREARLEKAQALRSKCQSLRAENNN